MRPKNGGSLGKSVVSYIKGVIYITVEKATVTFKTYDFYMRVG